MKLLTTLLMPAISVPVWLHAQTSIDASQCHAWSANAGWINARYAASPPTGVIATEYVLAGHAWAADLGWINFGSGSPAGMIRYSNSNEDFGVNHDGAGQLSGFAWSGNTGWINFGWAAPTNPSRPRLDLLTGAFSGFAWSPNLGWLNLGGGFLRATTLICPDRDGDRLADAWEHDHFGGLTASDGTGDADNDGDSDAAEFSADTDPRRATSRFTIEPPQFDSSLTTVRLIFSSTTSRLYRVESSDDLRAWAPVEGPFAPDTGFVTSRTVSLSGGPRVFLRVAPVKPLPGP